MSMDRMLSVVKMEASSLSASSWMTGSREVETLYAARSTTLSFLIEVGAPGCLS